MATTYYLSNDTTNYAITPGFVANSTKVPFDLVATPYILSNRLDFTTNHITSDGDEVVQAVAMPANVLIHAVWCYVEALDAGIADVDIGTGGGASQVFADGLSFATTGYKYPTAGAYAPGLANPGYFLGTTADTMDLLIKSAAEADLLVVEVYVLVTNCAVYTS